MNKGIMYMMTMMLFIVSCSVVPITGRRQLTAIPASQMLSLSQDSYSQVLKETEQSDNQVYVNRVRQVGINIAGAVEEYMREYGMEARIQEFDWEYAVFKSDQVNAWCMPGGKIGFYEGIMPVCEDDNGVAVVMSHEVAHALAQHGNERLSQQLAVQLGGMALSEALSEERETTQQLALLAFGVGSQLGVLLPYSRTHESEADELGLYFMAMAGYDPRGAVEFWTRMQQASEGSIPEFLSTHPNPANRIDNLNRHMDRALTYYNNQ